MPEKRIGGPASGGHDVVAGSAAAEIALEVPADVAEGGFQRLHLAEEVADGEVVGKRDAAPLLARLTG